MGYQKLRLFFIQFDHCRMFPDLEIITELTYPANMRFLGIHYSQNAPKYISFSQKKALEATPQDQDLFRPAFVSGSAISTSMLDTLLYQSYVKPYIISVIYLLIGLKQNAGSGTLIFVSFCRWGFQVFVCRSHYLPIVVERNPLTIRK